MESIYRYIVLMIFLTSLTKNGVLILNCLSFFQSDFVNSLRAAREFSSRVSGSLKVHMLIIVLSLNFFLAVAVSGKKNGFHEGVIVLVRFRLSAIICLQNIESAKSTPANGTHLGVGL